MLDICFTRHTSFTWSLSSWRLRAWLSWPVTTVFMLVLVLQTVSSKSLVSTFSSLNYRYMKRSRFFLNKSMISIFNFFCCPFLAPSWWWMTWKHGNVCGFDTTSTLTLTWIGKALEAVSVLVFLLLLILLAKGYTVTRARLKHKTSVKIGVFMGIYSLIYAILFVWERSVSYIVLVLEKQQFYRNQNTVISISLHQKSGLFFL